MKDKVIYNAVRTEGRLYKAGDEEALAKDVKPEELQRLTDLGAISGFVSAKSEEKPKGKK